MAEKTIRYGLIGAGMMGREHIRNLALIEGAEVVAVSDPDTAMRRQSRHLAGSGCRAFEDHRAMLDEVALDALVIAAPNHLHAPIMADVLETDLPILCEKPLGTTLAECRAIEARAAGRAAPVWVAMEYRYMPPVERLLKEVGAGTAGRVQMVSVREHRFPFLRKVGDWNRFSEKSGGTLVEKCCHFFDLMRLILRSDPVCVYASGNMDVNHLEEKYGGRRPDVLDNAFVIVEFAGGARAVLDLCMFAEGSYWQEVISATGDRARLDACVPGPARFIPDGKERVSRFVIADRATRTERHEEIRVDDDILTAGDHHGSTFFQHRKFIDMVRHGGAPEISVRDGLIAVAVGAAAEESARTGQPVSLKNLWEQ
ncbi:MAG: Gfo/Idh/MocA family protein [Paracoccaceae bacterium]